MADRSDMALPVPRQVLAELIHSIASSTMPGSMDGHLPLLATLHVLFPSLVLPALDLLDRRRVVRWGGRREQPKGAAPTSTAASTAASASSTQPSLYQIRGGSDRPHVVHLRSWHCTCAFFALQTAASTALSSKTPGGAETNQAAQHHLKDALSHLPLAFSTPPCKHLLACLLAEEWTVLHAYVVAGEDDTTDTKDDCACSPETLAGIVAGVL
ncbi:uncharacterized protein SPSK_00334 [Sporothrix schenckii 1099-18]|nr:uncharacterized protein SPSK_00334 [Sporothrix schenckii 1099-18]KJR84013.1 hypothetical protein SPSK_00334 [Sporothrix schenckii 1099-18]